MSAGTATVLTPMTSPTPDNRSAELMVLGQIPGIVQGLRYMGYVGTQDNLVRR